MWTQHPPARSCPFMTEGELPMENKVVQFAHPAMKHGERYVQIFVIDGCTVKVNFLPEKTSGGNKSTLHNIRKILLATDLAK